MKKFLSILLCVCLMFATVVAVPSISAEEQTEVKEYFYHANDYESLEGTEEWLSTIELGRAMSVESGANVISGGKSLKVTSDGVDWVGVGLSDAKVPANMNAHVSFDYKVTVGIKKWGGVGYIGHSMKQTNTSGEETVNCYNWSNIHNNSYTVSRVEVYEQKASTSVYTFKNTVARNGDGTVHPIGIYYGDDSAPSEVVFDNLVVAEVIKNVSALSADETKGTVAVANKDAKFTDFAMNETAVFTATPAEGYSFKGWYNGDVLVSTDATYEHTLTGDTTLTAKWKLEEKEYFYLYNDYESLTGDEAWLATIERGDAMLVESGTNVIDGTKSLKVTSDGVNADSPTKANYIGIALSPEKFPTNFNARISFNYKVTQGKISWGSVGYIGYSQKYTNTSPEQKVNCYNWSHINGKNYSVTTGGLPGVSAVSTVRSYTGTLARNASGSSYPIGLFYNDGTVPADPSEIIFDNLKIAEIIDTVAVVNSDEAKGTVSVANKEAKYTDYAKGEVAVFTATPAEGYSFKGWYDREDNLVSTSATYEHTLVTDTTLTAKWKLYEKEYDYKAYDYENMTDTDAWFATARDSVMSFETANPISGNSSLKITASKTGYMGGAVIPNNVALKSATTYRLTASTKVSTGVFNYGRVGSAGLSSGVVNIWNIGTGTEFTNGSSPVHLLDSNWVMYDNTKPVKTVTDKLTTATNGLLVFGGIFSVSAVDENSTASILIDDLVAAEIIGSVSATSSDSAMGSATVVNKAGYEDYAKNEIAVFTATPANGYYFEGWYDANGEKVSTDKVYEAALTTDTNLTAKFAAYDTLYTISFNTNGGNEIEDISNGEGADIVFPETPVKEGLVFAGWYSDAELTAPFTAKTFPAKDVTLYAKWAGSYQDFENYTATPNGNFTVMTDGENAYLGNGYLKYLATEKDGGQSRFVLSSNEALKDFATPGDQIKLSFKYKLLSGDARFYMHTSSASDKVVLTKAGNNDWLNVYEYENVNLTVSEDWKEITNTYDLKSYSKIATEGFDFEDFLYSVFIFSSNNGAELYIDEITLDVVPTVKVKTAYNNAAALRSAEASSTGKNGLRIYNEIDTHWVEDKNIVEYGSVAAFASNINGEITVENGRKGVAYSAADGISSAWEVTEHTVVFTSYLTNIGSARYTDDIVIRSYAIAADGTVYYGKTATVSVFEVANAIDNAQTADGSEVSAEDANAFHAFVNSANKSAYEAWCTENGKTVGSLFSAK